MAQMVPNMNPMAHLWVCEDCGRRFFHMGFIANCQKVHERPGLWTFMHNEDVGLDTALEQKLDRPFTNKVNTEESKHICAICLEKMHRDFGYPAGAQKPVEYLNWYTAKPEKRTMLITDKDGTIKYCWPTSK